MGTSSQFDIVARLQLRAEQFSSESGRSFADMASRAKVAAAGVRDSFSQSFAEVQKLADRSLQLPRTATGSLDLSAEIATLRTAATATDETASAQRELSAAMLAASGSGRVVAESMRTEADAAMVAARASEADATAIRQRILALEEVQRELNKTASATHVHTEAANDNTLKSGQQRAGMQQLSFQLNDVAVQYAAGTSASIIFAQQSGQVVQALSLIAGEAKGVLGFLGGPWGMALTTALVVLSPFVGKLLEGNDALADSIDKLRKDAAETELNRRAKEAFTNTIEGQIDAQRRLTSAIERSTRTQRQAQQLVVSQQQQALETNREVTKPRAQENLTAARAQVKDYERRVASFKNDPKAFGATVAAEGLIKARQILADAQRQFDQVNDSIAAGEIALRKAQQPLIANDVEAALDRKAAAATRYTKQLALLNAQQAIGAGKSGSVREMQADGFFLSRTVNGISNDDYRRELARISREKEAAEKAAEAAEQAANRSSSANRQTGRPLSSSEAAAIVRAIGGQVNSADRTTAQQTALYTAWIKAGKPANNPVARPGTSAHEMGNGLDVQMSAGMTPAKLRAAFEREGVQLTKVFAEKGHWHVEWAKSGTAARDLAAGIREAEQEQAKLDASLDSIQGKFDPAAQAARRYAEELAEIDKLQAGGRISGAQAEVYRFRATSDESARRATASNESGTRIFAAQIDQADDWFAQQAEWGKEAQRDIVDLWLSAGDAFRRGADAVVQLLGIRVSGPLGAVLQPGGVEGQASDMAKVITDCFGRGLKLDDATIEKWTGRLSTIIGNASYGQIGGSVFSSITGGKESKAGSAIGGIIGGELGKMAGPAVGKALSGVVGQTLGKSLGGMAGPLGAIAGGVLGSVIGGLFKKKSPSGSVDITGTDKGDVTSSGKLGSALTGNASAVQKSLTQIAEQLGAVTGAFSVSIGKSGDWYHVAGTAGADVSAAHPKSPLLYEGKDESLAVQAAILNALQDGAIKGISEAATRILKSGQDLDVALQKALLIEAVPRDLKAILDPVGAAIDDLNRKFQKTVDALKEGGASAEQMAQAQRLYDMQLDQVKASTSSASQSLKDFMTSMKLGSSSPYSLRDQEATARGQLQPYLDQIAAGKTIDQAKYQSAATAFLDVERQLYGSTQAYFDALNSVQAATIKAISSIDNAAPITTAVSDPFTKATAESTAKAAAAAQTGNEMAEDTNALLARMVDLQAQLVARLGTSGAAGFIGADRLFSQVA